MALIDCPECGRKVSQMAPACPSCAHPIRALTIEATGKRWKAMQLGFGALLLLGFPMLFVHSSAAAPMLLIGGIGFIYSAMGAWWQHG